MAPPNEPTNAELMTLLQQHMSNSSAANREQAAASAALQTEMREMRGSLREQGVKILEIDRRLTKTEHDAKRLRDSHADLEGSLLREVGALATNDKMQNATLAAIKADVGTQGKTLQDWSETKAGILTGLKVVKWMVGGAVVAVPTLWEFARWIAAHVTL